MDDSKKLIGAGIIALSLFLFWVLPYGEYTKIAELQNAITERQQLVAERQATIDQLKELQSKYADKKNDIQTFSAIVPLKRSTAELISSVESIAAASGIQVANLSFSEGKSDNQYSTVAVAVNGKGSYTGVKAFLENFERNIRLLDVQSLKMSLNQQTGEIDLDVQANSYFLKQ